jgi:NAD(P)-dependent dehydrogenase (short-subunit alcohol dehydrogenase family)
VTKTGVTVAVVTGAGSPPGRAIAGEPAAMACFLAGPDAPNASGQTIELNGGRVMS